MFSCSFLLAERKPQLILLTNNPDVVQCYEARFIDGTYRDVLVEARDLVHRGHRLLSHPLMGSLKPNETPYRTVALSEEAGSLDLDSLQLIENAIETFDKFAKVLRPDRGVNTPAEMLADFRLIDLSLIQSMEVNE